MQDANEASAWSVKTIKEKLYDLDYKYPWVTRLAMYFFLLLVVSYGFYFLFTEFNLFHTDPVSARYMLSAMVQAQAAIIAIVVTLTLVAVQLTASAYSPRVVDVFKSSKKNPDFWIILIFYSISIIYGLFLLKLVVGTGGEFVNQTPIWPSFHPIVSFEHGISIAYWLGAFTLVILFPYMWNIINLLKPETIISRLATDITKDTLLSPEEDPIQPIMDIMHGSLMKYDITTTRVGLKAVTDHVITLIEAESIDQKDQQKIIERFCTPVEFVGLLAVSNLEDEISAIEVIANFKSFGEASAEKELLSATWQVAGSLGVLGKATAEKGFESATIEAVESIGKIGVAAAKKRLSIALGEAALSLGEIGVAAAENKLKDATRQAVWSLVVVGKVAVEKELENEVEQAAESLVDITMVSEEIVKNVIRKYESALGEEDQTVFQKFVGLYRQGLQKLQAEQQE